MTHKTNVLILVLCLACKKEVGIVKPVPLSSVTVVNAVMNSDPLIVSFTPDSPVNAYLNATPQIGFQSFKEYSLPSGNTLFLTYQSSDTSHPLFNGAFAFNPNTIHSLYFYGQYNAQNPPDTLLTEDHPLYHPVGDSTVSIRFINIFPANYAINVNILGGSSGSGIQNLSYRGFTQFLNYPVTSNVPSPSTGYTFEFRSASTDSILTTFKYAYRNIARFKNVTIVLSAASGGTAAKAFMVNNY